MTLLLRHIGRVLGDLVAQAVQMRDPWILVVVVAGAVAALLGLMVNAVGPVIVYPFL